MTDAEMLTAQSQGTSTGSGSAPAPRRGGRRREEMYKILFVVPAALTIILLFGYPVVKNFTMSFQEYTLKTFFTGKAPWVGLENYVTVVTDDVFSQALVNTALFTDRLDHRPVRARDAAGPVLPQELPAQRRAPGACSCCPGCIPLIVGSAAWRSLLEQDSGIINITLENLGIIDTPIPWLTSPDVALIAVIMVNIWIGIPFNVTLLYSGLQDIPEELYEAGSLDGATGWKAFWHITWPNLRAVVSVVLMLGVIYTLKVLDIILGLTRGGPANATQTIATQSYQRSFVEFKFGQGAALSNILILISLVFAIVYLRATRRRVDE